MKYHHKGAFEGDLNGVALPAHCQDDRGLA